MTNRGTAFNLKTHDEKPGCYIHAPVQWRRRRDVHLLYTRSSVFVLTGIPCLGHIPSHREMEGDGQKLAAIT